VQEIEAMLAANAAARLANPSGAVVCSSLHVFFPFLFMLVNFLSLSFVALTGLLFS